MTMTSSSPDWIGAARAVQHAERILIATHFNPDGDAIGSLLGIGNALLALGKSPVLMVDGGVPDYLQFVPNSNQVIGVIPADPADGAPLAFDLMIAVDSSDEARTGKAGEYGRARSATVINLDHHATNTRFGDYHLVVPDAVSATEIAAAWLPYLGVELTADIAIPLLTGLVTDTIGFRISSVTPNTLALAQELMAAGASLAEIVAQTLNNKPYSSLELWKYALQTVQLNDDLISGRISKEDLGKARLGEAMDGGLIGLLISIREAVVAVVYKEKSDNTVEISFRSKVGYDISVVAKALGGGGHKQAAGATLPGSPDQVEAQVTPYLREAIRAGRAALAPLIDA